MKRRSAGLLMYRFQNGDLQVLLIHPGGPFWKGREMGAWSIPKGEFDDTEDALEAAKREFVEETGFAWSEPFIELQSIKQAGGKRVFAWAFEGDCDPSKLVSNTFEIEYPPRTGRMTTFPEADKAGWFDLAAARRKMHVGQLPFLEQLERAAQLQRQ
jgi:predicted NUDIX family NTP pyrophosphohydrolase